MTASNTIDKAAAKADSTVKEVEISLREVIEQERASLPKPGLWGNLLG